MQARNEPTGDTPCTSRSWTGSIALCAAAALCLPRPARGRGMNRNIPTLAASGSGRPGSPISSTSASRRGSGSEVPLTPEYQAIYEAGLQDQNEGGQGNDPTYSCIPDGMPRVMNVIFPMEIVVTPEDHLHPDRVPDPAAPHLHRRTQTSPRTFRPPSRAIRSANGSMRMATASTTCSKSRPAF